MKNALIKLCNPKTQILIKAEKKPVFDKPSEKITLNQSFENSNIRLMMLPQPNAKMMAQGAGGAKS